MKTMKNREIIGKAFYKSIPVMAGYIVLGIGFGILLRNAVLSILLGTIAYMVLIRIM